MDRPTTHPGLTLLEAVLSIVLIMVLLSLLLPALSSARSHGFRERCQEHQRLIGQGWQMYLADYNNQFPFVPLQPGWQYGGVRFSAVNDNALPDLNRPLTPYLPMFVTNDARQVIWCCPADRGINNPNLPVGTGKRTAFRTFGTSYRANAALLYHLCSDEASGPESHAELEPRGLRRAEITTAPSRLVLGGDALWHEIAESTGLRADWHGHSEKGNLLFLDGSVRFMNIRPRQEIGPVVYDPMMPGSVPLTREE